MQAVVTLKATNIPPGETYTAKATPDRDCLVHKLWAPAGKTELKPHPAPTEKDPKRMVDLPVTTGPCEDFELMSLVVAGHSVFSPETVATPLRNYRDCGIGKFYLPSTAEVELTLRNTSDKPASVEVELRGKWMSREEMPVQDEGEEPTE